MLQSFFFIILFLPTLALAKDFPSAVRKPHEDYKEIIKSFPSSTEFTTPTSAKGPFSDLKHEEIVEWESLEQMQERFMEIRDERFINTGSEDFLRRISWLYPDDGCFARAALFIEKSEEKAFEPPSRIFVFGNLEVETANHSAGKVNWWYHTAPVVRVGSEVYVLDAALDPYQPILVKDWILKQVDKLEDAEVAYCKSYTYAPFSNCTDPLNSDDDRGLEDQKRYLNYEWNRQEELGRVPEDVLGLYPPWLQ